MKEARRKQKTIGRARRTSQLFFNLPDLRSKLVFCRDSILLVSGKSAFGKDSHMRANRTKRAKRNGKAKRITARSINLVDSDGKTRIVLDAGDSSGFSSICLFGKESGSIQICSQPNGALMVGLPSKACHAVLALNPSGDSQLALTDRKGRHGTTVGSMFEPGNHSVVLFKNGQVCWQIPDGVSGKKIQRRRSARAL